MRNRPPAESLSRCTGGFTLLELMVVIAVAGILTVIAIPSYTRIVAAQRVRTTSSDLFISLIRARSEAIKRGTNVTLTPSSSGWQNGWSIPDPSSNTNPLLESHSAVGGVTVSGPTSVVYQSSGRLNSTTPSCTSNPPVACFVITSTATSWSGAASCVSVDISGRPYSASGVSTC